jgi:hypothetical protein
VGGALWAGLSNLAFAGFAHDTSSAVIIRALIGLGVAGIYMPGVKFISQNIPSYSEEELKRAKAIVEAYEKGVADGQGVISLDGKMIDKVNLRMAESILKQHQVITEKDGEMGK